MKYLFIDTNIYIQCCLLELEGDNLDTLNDLEKLLEKNKVKLLLPEVVELEFYKVLENKFSELKKKIGLYGTSIKNDKSFDEKIREDLVRKLEECVKDREKNTEKVKEKMEGIFGNKKFTIKKDLAIKEKYLLNAYKSFLSGEKPSKEGAGTIQPDCVIIETLASYFQGTGKYELFFCSANKWDFAQNPKAENSFSIHKDIAKRFKNIKYYVNLFELLNAEFGGQYSKESIEKIKEKEAEVYIYSPSVSALGNIRSTEFPTSLGEMYDYCKSELQGVSFADSGGGILGNSVLGTDGGSLVHHNASCAIPEDSLHHASLRLMPLKHCKKCGKSYEISQNILADDGLCDMCRSKGLV